MPDPRSRINRPPIRSASDLAAFLLLFFSFVGCLMAGVAFLWVLAAVAGE
jgi:hypothetical protein